MANVIRLKRASGSDPAASDLVSGEPAVRTDTGELFFKKDDGSIAKVAGAGGGPDFKYLALRNAANNGAASFPNADFTLVTSGTTTAITPTAANTLLVSVNGVIQKPNTGTSTPSQGFALSGSTIKFGANISAAPDFILYQESGGIGEPSDDTVSEVKLKVSNSPVNGYFLSAQSGNNGGLTWAAPIATSCTGNSATATALATARTINGTSFDGTSNITVTAAAGTLTGNTLNSSVTASSLTSLGDLASLTVNGDMALTGANYNVLWDKSDNALEFADNAKAKFGTGNDLQIYHDPASGGSSFIDVTGTLQIHTSQLYINNEANTERLLRCTQDGSVELYHDGTKKFETTTNGNSLQGAQQDLQGDVKFDNQANPGMDLRWDESLNRLHFEQDDIKAVFGASSDFEIYHNGSTNIINGLYHPIELRHQSEVHIKCVDDGAVELYHNNSKKFETTSVGAFVTGFLGINVASPDSPLEVGGTGPSLATIHHTDGGTNDEARIMLGALSSNPPDQRGAGISARNKGAGHDLEIQTSSTHSAGPSTKMTVTAGGNVQIANDSGRLQLGASQDLQIYHNGTNSYVRNSTGQLLVGGSGGDLVLEALGDVRTVTWEGENMIYAKRNGAVELYYDNVKKFETNSDGVLVTRNTSDTNMTNTSQLVLRNTNDGANTFAGIRFEVSSNTNTDHFIVQKKHSGGSGTDLIIGHGSNERLRFIESGGFTFNGDTASSNALDDYEEGTWTPSFYPLSSGIPITYTTRQGKYTKIGNVVYWHCKIQVSNITGNRNQAFGISGFPHNITNSQAQVSGNFYGETWDGEIPTTLKYFGNVNRGQLYYYSDTMKYFSSSMLDININSSMLMGSGFYYTH